MPRQPRCIDLVLGLALILGAGSLALTPSRASAFADEPHKDAKSETGGAGHDAGHAAETPQVLKFEPTLAIWSLLVFAIMAAILAKYAWTPIVKALDERERNLQQAYQDAESARAEAKRLHDDYQAQLTKAASEAKALVEEARRDAEFAKSDILKNASAEAAAIKQRAEAAISLAKDEALKDLWERSAQLAVAIAGRVLSRDLGDDDQRRLVQQAISEMSALKEARA